MGPPDGRWGQSSKSYFPGVRAQKATFEGSDLKKLLPQGQRSDFACSGVRPSFCGFRLLLVAPGSSIVSAHDLSKDRPFFNILEVSRQRPPKLQRRLDVTAQMQARIGNHPERTP